MPQIRRACAAGLLETVKNKEKFTQRKSSRIARELLKNRIERIGVKQQKSKGIDKFY